MNTGSCSKSEGEVNHLVNEVLDAPDFCAKDLCGFSANRENGRLDTATKASPLDDGFQVALVTIEVPTGKPSNTETSRPYSVPGLHCRKLLNVIKAAFQDPLSCYFHLTPFSLMHRSPLTGEEQRVYCELYHSDAFIKEHNRVQNCSPPPPDDPGCKLKKVVAALMFWSDSTHLTNFGTAKLWPVYLFFWKPLKVHSISTIFRGLQPSRLHPLSVCLLKHLTSTFYLVTYSTAPRLVRKLDRKLAPTLGDSTKSAYGPLPAQAYASRLEVYFRR